MGIFIIPHTKLQSPQILLLSSLCRKLSDVCNLFEAIYSCYNILILMDQYRLQNKKGEGTFSQVFMAQSIKNNRYVAIKCMKKKYESIEKVKRLKEIQALKLLMPHQYVINLIQVLYDQPSGKLALVFQLMEQNLYESLVQNKHLNQKKVKVLMYQLLKAIEYIHSKGIFHRDIKPENVLVKGDCIKLADFGSCKGIYSKAPYTQYISTRWYRAPECLMTDGYYDYKMDIWGYGCVLFEMIAKYPLFNGVDELDQIHKINKVLGTPRPDLIDYFKTHASHMGQNDFNFPQKRGIGFEKLLPNASRQLIDLLYKLLAYDPQERISAKEALRHQYFADIAESRFRSTVFNPPTEITKRKHNEETPQKQTIRKKKTKKHGLIDEQVNSLPPIHHFRLDVKFNLYSSTTKTQDNVFKKTLANVHKEKKKEENYMVMGKRFEK